MYTHHSTDLSLHIGFTADDLYANRQGLLSDAQRSRLKRDLLREAIGYGAAEAVLLAILLVGISAMIGQTDNASPPIIVLLLALLSSIYPVYMVVRWRATRRDLVAGKVEQAAGRVQLDYRGRGVFRLDVGSRSFVITKPVYEAFVHDHAYRVYYAPNLKVILAAEPTD